MEFKGTIVITDPCYFAKDCDWDESGNFDYEDCTIHGLGFSDYIWMPTGIGDGSWSVFGLDEVLEYNPSFLSDIGNWCYTVIPDFKGNVDVLECNEDRDFVILGVGNKTFYTR